MSIAAIVLLSAATVLAVGNILGILGGRLRGESFSTVPLFSLVFSVAAWSLAPDRIGPRALLPAALDPATWSPVCLPVYLLIHRRRAS
ncbi:MAG: hypothetical protein ABFS86_02775 [Planctomycetota bacterium]